MRTGLVALRATFGITMAGHGLQKLFGWFGGGGLQQTAAGFERNGILPARRNALLAGTTETLTGLSILLGFMTPLGATGMTGTMFVAMRQVHLKNGLWISNGGCEYNLAIIAAAYALADLGPGPLAVDGTLMRARHGTTWALAQLALGMSGATVVLAHARRLGHATES